MDLAAVRDKWVQHNIKLLDGFSLYLKEYEYPEDKITQWRDLLEYFAIDFLLDFESEIEEDPDNLDDGIITLDTVTWGYADSFLGRWYIQKSGKATEESIKKYQTVLGVFCDYLKQSKQYKQGAADLKKLKSRFDNKKKYIKRFKDYEEIQQIKDDEEKYLDLMQEWEYEDL